MAGEKKLALQRADICVRCRTTLRSGTFAWWDAAARLATCASCHDEPPSVPPPSAAALLAPERAPMSPSVSRAGQSRSGQSAVALAERVLDVPLVNLYSRRLPDGAELDHVAVTPTGVWVIDTRDYTGAVRIEKPWFGRPRLRVDGRNKTGVIDALDRQVHVVADVLSRFGCRELTVHGVVCFTRADLPAVGTLRVRGYELLYRTGLLRRLNAPGPLAPTAVEHIGRLLAGSLPPA